MRLQHLLAMSLLLFACDKFKWGGGNPWSPNYQDATGVNVYNCIADEISVFKKKSGEDWVLVGGTLEQSNPPDPTCPVEDADPVYVDLGIGAHTIRVTWDDPASPSCELGDPENCPSIDANYDGVSSGSTEDWIVQ